MIGPEAKVRQVCEGLLRGVGVVVIPIKPDASNGLDEYPDILALGVNGRFEWIEFKAPGKNPRPGQKKVLAFLASLGHTTLVARGHRDVIPTMKRLGRQA